MAFSEVTHVFHADWSTTASKRVGAWALRSPQGNFTAYTPYKIQDCAMMVKQMAATCQQGGLLAGFDFPIGFPIAYAQNAGVHNFIEMLPGFGQAAWDHFYHPAVTADQVSLHRPFYPQKPGGSTREALVTGLKVASFDDLRRVCERGHADRRAASPLFWTLGAQQVGKAAIAGWQEILLPALKNKEVFRFWPFDGSLEQLLATGKAVLAETYPAEYYSLLGVAFSRSGSGLPGGKRSQKARQAQSAALLRFARHTGIDLHPELHQEIVEGFGAHPSGEDSFDAVVGLFAMIAILTGRLDPGDPLDPQIRVVEGWILGHRYLENGRVKMASSQSSEAYLRTGFKLFNHFMLFMWRMGLGSWFEFYPALSGRVLVITHTGRKTGTRRRTPVNYAIVNGEIYCVSGFGKAADWYLNIKANPNVEIWLPDSWWIAKVEDVTAGPDHIHLMRQVLIGSGFAAYVAGLNPHTLSDQALDDATKTYRLVKIQRLEPRTGPGGPGDLAWIWPLATMLLLPLALRRRKSR